MSLRRWFLALLWLLQALLPGPAAGVVLTFEGLQQDEQILEFYGGGGGSLGSAGPDYGVSFGGTALASLDIDAGGKGNFANEPSPATSAFWRDGTSLVMNVPGGFAGGFSFFYTSAAAATVTVYDGVGASGNVLGTIDLVLQFGDGGCTGDPQGDFCHWSPAGVAFAGIARSVDFAGTANRTGFDNITLGSAVPVRVPAAPTSMLMLAGLVLLCVRTIALSPSGDK